MILALRTDKPEAELHLLRGGKVVAVKRWQAHRQLSNTLLTTIEGFLGSQKLSLGELEGLIVFQGPGSFTGLRIGITAVNTLAYSLQITNVAARGEHWLTDGASTLRATSFPSVLMPFYGRDANVTLPRK